MRNVLDMVKREKVLLGFGDAFRILSQGFLLGCRVGIKVREDSFSTYSNRGHLYIRYSLEEVLFRGMLQASFIVHGERDNHYSGAHWYNLRGPHV